MKKTQSTLLTICLLAVATLSNAATGDVSLGVKAGTLGAGVEAGVDLSDYFALRGGLNYISFDVDATVSHVDYTFEPEFMNGSLLLDWHPFTNSFRVTAGAYLNNNTVDVDGTYRKDLIPAEYQRYAGLVDQAHVKGTVDYNTFAPYVGLGWTSNKADRGWGVNIDLGVMFQGAPKVSELYVDDPWGIGKNEVVITFLEDERQAVVDELDKYEYYPVASIELTYKF